VLQLGTGFAGIFIAFDFFISNINPAVKALMIMIHIDLPILDVGWPPLAAITWASPIAHLSIPIIIGINILMLTFNLTRTIYLDIWNYWHFAMLGALVLNASDSIILALVATALIAVYTIKMSDWAAPIVKREMALDGITLSPLSSVGLLPYAQFLDAIFNRIPNIKPFAWCIIQYQLRTRANPKRPDYSSEQSGLLVFWRWGDSNPRPNGPPNDVYKLS